MRFEAGIHPDVAMRDYHNAPAVNAHLLKLIVDECPAAAWFASWLNPESPIPDTSAAMDAGSIAHAMFLEGDVSRVAVIDPNDYPSKTTGAIPEGWTNKDIRAARERAYADGKIPVLKAAIASIEAMVGAARRFVDSLETDEPALYAMFQPGGGDSELTVMWDEDGVPCRIRPDRISTDRRIIVDYKTGMTSAEPNTWARVQMVRMGYYSSAAFYRRGIKRACGVDCAYVYLVQEMSAPYLCSLVGVDEETFALGDAKTTYALDLWRECARAGRWASYPTRVCYPVLPTWERARWEEMETLGIPYDPAKAFGKPLPGIDL